MRWRLEGLVGQRCIFRARFIRFGSTPLFDGRYIHWMLIEDVRNEREEYVTHHTWIPLRPWDYVYAPIRHGDLIQFDAEVEMYTKGRKGEREIDYGLWKPANVEHIEQFEAEQEA